MQYPIRILNLFMVLDRGGAETLVMNIYRHIDRSKVQFDFLVHGTKEGAYENEIRALGGKIYRMPEIGLGTLRVYNKRLKEFFASHPEYNIVHAHNSELGLFALRQAKLAGVPCRICHAHNAPKGLNRKTFLRYLFKKLTLLYITDMFSCSNDAGYWQFGKRATFQTINNGIIIDQFSFNEQRRNELKLKFHLENNFIIGHVGRFEIQKNHLFLLKVFEEIVHRKSDAILMLIGEGTLKPEIEKVVAAKKLTGKVKFLGSQGNVSDYLQGFDVFLFPSLFEGLGIAAVEAQAAGLPCFCSDAVPRQVALTDLCSFLPLNAPEKWADKILATELPCRDNPEVCQKIKQAGYDIMETVAYLENFYLERVLR